MKGNFTLNNYAGNTKTVEVDLTWTGIGDTYRGNSHSHYQGPGYISNSRYNGAYRDADVSGSIILDGTNVIANLPSDAYIRSSNSGSLSITRK